MRRTLVVGALAASVSLGASAASARSIQDERYNYDLIWNAAVRLIRVDLGFPIVERDRDSGFVLFTYRDSGRTSAGSLEVVRATVDGVAGSRVIVQIADMPSYAERFVLNRLERKLHEEYGEPPPPVHHDPNAHDERHPDDDHAHPDDPHAPREHDPATPSDGDRSRPDETPDPSRRRQ